MACFALITNNRVLHQCGFNFINATTSVAETPNGTTVYNFSIISRINNDNSNRNGGPVVFESQ